MENMDKGTHCNKMGADGSAENTPNAPRFICQICLLNPKSSGFHWKKASLGVRSPFTNAWQKARRSIQGLLALGQ